MSFKDHFSQHAGHYAQFRPSYPKSLIEDISEKAPQRNLVWDCATGNGQAALLLSEHFRKVIATDASDSQIQSAEKRSNIEYRVAPAESSGIEAAGVDLVTVAQALHWFDLSQFYPEVRRVCRPGAFIAAWCYELCHCSKEVDDLMEDYYRNQIGKYWPRERVHVENGYRDLDFPFQEEKAGSYQMDRQWTVEQYLGYLGTWSGTQRAIAAEGEGIFEKFCDSLRKTWGTDPVRSIVWPISIRWGRVV